MDKGLVLAVMGSLKVLDLLPVMLFISCSSAVPGLAMLALSTGEETVVSSTRVVLNALPFQRTTVAWLTFDPTTSTVVSGEPAVIVCGTT